MNFPNFVISKLLCFFKKTSWHLESDFLVMVFKGDIVFEKVKLSLYLTYKIFNVGKNRIRSLRCFYDPISSIESG